MFKFHVIEVPEIGARRTIGKFADMPTAKIFVHAMSRYCRNGDDYITVFFVSEKEEE